MGNSRNGNTNKIMCSGRKRRQEEVAMTSEQMSACLFAALTNNTIQSGEDPPPNQVGSFNTTQQKPITNSGYYTSQAAETSSSSAAVIMDAAHEVAIPGAITIDCGDLNDGDDDLFAQACKDLFLDEEMCNNDPNAEVSNHPHPSPKTSGFSDAEDFFQNQVLKVTHSVNEDVIMLEDDVFQAPPPPKKALTNLSEKRRKSRVNCTEDKLYRDSKKWRIKDSIRDTTSGESRLKLLLKQTTCAAKPVDFKKPKGGQSTATRKSATTRQPTTKQELPSTSLKQSDDANETVTTSQPEITSVFLAIKGIVESKIKAENDLGIVKQKQQVIFGDVNTLREKIAKLQKELNDRECALTQIDEELKTTQVVCEKYTNLLKKIVKEVEQAI